MSDTNPPVTTPAQAATTPPAQTNPDDEINKIIKEIDFASKEKEEAITSKINALKAEWDGKNKEQLEEIGKLKKELDDTKNNSSNDIRKELDTYKEQIKNLEKQVSTRMSQVPTGNPNTASQGTELKDGWLIDPKIPADKKLEYFKKEFNI